MWFVEGITGEERNSPRSREISTLSEIRPLIPGAMASVRIDRWKQVLRDNPLGSANVDLRSTNVAIALRAFAVPSIYDAIALDTLGTGPTVANTVATITREGQDVLKRHQQTFACLAIGHAMRSSPNDDRASAPESADQSPISHVACNDATVSQNEEHSADLQPDITVEAFLADWGSEGSPVPSWLDFTDNTKTQQLASDENSSLSDLGLEAALTGDYFDGAHHTDSDGLRETDNANWIMDSVDGLAGLNLPSESLNVEDFVDGFQGLFHEDAAALLGDVELVNPSFFGDPVAFSATQTSHSPLKRIINVIQSHPGYSPGQEGWFTIDQIHVYLRNYFKFFHPSTPFIHCPSWTIPDTRPHLLFAMALTGSMYTPDSPIPCDAMRVLYHLVDEIILDFDKIDGEAVQVDTLQALHLLSLLDAYIARRQGSPSVFNYERLVSKVRSAGYLTEGSTSDRNGKYWRQWIKEESKRRTIYIIYLFDAIRTVFFRERPKISPYEVDLQLPNHEALFNAATEEEWRYQADLSMISKLHYPAIFAAFVGNVTSTDRIPLSVMGGFIVLHGLMVYVWQTCQHLGTSDWTHLDDDDHQIFHDTTVYHQETMDSAMQAWRNNWEMTIHNDMSRDVYGIYVDHALSYWGLMCCLSKPNCAYLIALSSDQTAYTKRVFTLMKHLDYARRRGYLIHIDSVLKIREIFSVE
ncbi:hypothetical protein BDV39DRAFT_202087 [Aspergillus sergii]|uniref:Xylanolytic transcriptional activator regulatory domain-containing protein n=1 Tax=Aspergillus sergii TaxID=1034303 RepID=A0A5N6XBG3_9EURO|nr:hypothetical protein BDV39DRAFT_202087 [Aspergillus sergii]